jgi:hypothetical protein
VEKVAQNLGYFGNFKESAQSKKIAQYLGESSPNLVTLPSNRNRLDFKKKISRS